jgi:hypothetical protein
MEPPKTWTCTVSPLASFWKRDSHGRGSVSAKEPLPRNPASIRFDDSGFRVGKWNDFFSASDIIKLRLFSSCQLSRGALCSCGSSGESECSAGSAEEWLMASRKNKIPLSTTRSIKGVPVLPAMLPANHRAGAGAGCGDESDYSIN